MVFTSGCNVVRSGHVEHVRMARLPLDLIQGVDNFSQMDNAMGCSKMLQIHCKPFDL